jgi:hypothetical protein
MYYVVLYSKLAEDVAYLRDLATKAKKKYLK